MKGKIHFVAIALSFAPLFGEAAPSVTELKAKIGKLTNERGVENIEIIQFTTSYSNGVRKFPLTRSEGGPQEKFIVINGSYRVMWPHEKSPAPNEVKESWPFFRHEINSFAHWVSYGLDEYDKKTHSVIFLKTKGAFQASEFIGPISEGDVDLIIKSITKSNQSQ